MNNSNQLYSQELTQFETLVQKVSTEDQSILIVNAGRMNHGKSSLFNALADKEDLFTVSDCPTTFKCHSVDIGGNILLIDTPGIDARDADTVEAFRAYKEADYILFVHNINVGELHDEELDAINKIAAEFPTSIDFWQRFCLVITRSDNKKVDIIDKIIEKIKVDIMTKCQGKDFRVFATSSVRYWKGKNNQVEVFVQESGINALRDYLKNSAVEYSQ